MNKIVTILLLLAVSSLIAQDSTAINRILKFQQELNQEFASEDTSPLLVEDLEQFRTLDFFKIDTTFCVKAKFVRTPYETPFIMKTTTDREPLYVKYGEARLTLKEKEIVLSIYRSQALQMDEKYKDYLFLPFTDLTNGETSYQGGRFIDLKIPEGNTILIDFNTAYNPYCAYSDRYSCPIPPEENNLDLAIIAGVKKYKQILND